MSRKVIKLSRNANLKPADSLAGMRIDYQSLLNPAQLRAVTTVDGPVLIIAGAGSGKTRVITYRTAFLAEKGVPPEQLVLLTFTRRAANEMLARAESLTGMDLRRIEGGTFHAFANKMLHRFGKHIGLAQNFTVIDQSDSQDAVKKVRDSLGLDAKEKRFPNKGTLLSIISKARNKGVTIKQVVDDEVPQFEDQISGIEAVAKGYERLKVERQLLDFDDLLFSLRALLESPKGEVVARRFRYVMADEYQDTNGVQADIIALLARGHGNVCVVGDDAQCIYTWRGSSFENILAVEDRYPGVQIIKLETNYRSTQSILDVANVVMQKAVRSYTKALQAVRSEGERPLLIQSESTEDQASFIAATVLQQREEGIPLKEMAVLCRAVWHLRDLELELNRRNIPYVVFGGIKFAEAAHIKDMLALLRVGVNPKDDLSLKRILELLPRIGPATSDKIIDSVSRVEEPFGPLIAPSVRLPAPTKSRVVKLGELLRRLNAGVQRPAASVELAKTFYLPILEERYDDHLKREPDLELLVSFAAPYRSLQSYLADMMLTPSRDRAQDRVDASEDEDEHLVLSTVHSAKGLEFKTVFIPHLVDGLFPSSRSFGNVESLEEERRLFYVAVTRAKERLFLCHPSFVAGPQSWDSGGGLTMLSRFVDEDVDEFIDRAEVEWE